MASGLFRITQRAHYGLLLMTELAARYRAGGVLALEEMARSAGLSQGFLEQVAARLKKAGLVAGRRGAGGGYRLARPPRRITVADALEAVEGPLIVFDCVGGPIRCALAGTCANHGLWTRVRKGINDNLRSLTLAEIAGLKHRKKRR